MLMRMRCRFTTALSILLSLSMAVSAQAPASATTQIESIQDLVAHLTPEQKQQFDDAMNDFNTQRYAAALPIYKQLLQQLQGDAVLLKLAAEAALNTGDTESALTSLKPLTAANPNDWQAAALLTRACAESGDKTCRDSGMGHMLELHQHGATPPAMKRYLLERVHVGENTLLIHASLEPWGPYKVYDLGQVLGSDGRIFLRITLESNDSDQVLFAKQHPQEAAAGVRSFSLDAYRETGLNSSGQRTQTHSTYRFFVGQPPYDTVRQEFMNVANGKANPMTSTTNLVVP